MNGWKVAFWICFSLLIGVCGFSMYTVLDQGVTITYMREGYEDTEADLNVLMELVNTTDLSKEQVKAALQKHHLVEYMEFSSDSVAMDRIILTFHNGKLKNVASQW